MANATGEAKQPTLRATFDRRLKVEFRDARITPDDGLLADRDLDDALGPAAAALAGGRPGKRHPALIQINAGAVVICDQVPNSRPDSNPGTSVMTITPKEKELAAVGISVAAGCKPCTDHHVGVARKARASDLEEAVVAALAVRKSATQIMAGYALTKLGEPGQPGDGGSRAESNRQTELVAVGAAFAVNCVASLEAHLAAADAVGIAQEEITEVVKLATFIKERAASHVERLVGLAGAPAA